MSGKTECPKCRYIYDSIGSGDPCPVCWRPPNLTDRIVIITPFAWENSMKYFPCLSIKHPEKQQGGLRFFDSGDPLAEDEAMQMAMDLARMEADKINGGSDGLIAIIKIDDAE